MSTAKVFDEIQKSNPSAIIELFELQLDTSLHGASTIYRFHAGSNLNANGEIVLGTMSAILLTVNQTTVGNDLTGAKVTRIRTMAKFLDAVNFSGNSNSTADPTAEFKREIYIVDRKATETRDIVELELAQVWDLAGVRVPKRQCTRSIFPSIGSFN